MKIIDYEKTFLRRHVPKLLGLVGDEVFRDVLALKSIREELDGQGMLTDATREKTGLRAFFYATKPDLTVYLPVQVFEVDHDFKPRGRRWPHLSSLVKQWHETGRKEGVLLVSRSGSGKTVAALKACCDCFWAVEGEPLLAGMLPVWLRVPEELPEKHVVEHLLLQAAGWPDLTLGGLERLLAYSPGLLVCIDLNAVSHEVRPQIARALRAFQQKYGGRHRLLVAYRSTPGNDATLDQLMKGDHFVRFDMAPVAGGQAKLYLETIRAFENEAYRAAQLPPPHDETRLKDDCQWQIDLIERQAREGESIISTPMLMHFLSQIKPSNRMETITDVYEEIVKQHFARERSYCGLPDSLLGDDAGSDIKTALTRLALALLDEGSASTRLPPDRIHELWLDTEVAAKKLCPATDFWAASRYYTQRFSEQQTKHLPEFSLLQRDGRDGGLPLGFLHDSFIYFFAGAYALARYRDPRFTSLPPEWYPLVVARLVEQPDKWRLAMEFLGGALSEDQLLELVKAFVLAEPKPVLPELLHRMLRGGRGRRARLLRLAVERDLAFLIKHPECIFQSLWNLGWWYDCAEAEKHYQPWSGDGPAPWAIRSQEKLSTWLMQTLRPEWERLGHPWVRTLRPPAVRLGDPLLSTIRGHEDAVESVAISPDGSRIISGSRDNTVRVWETARGTEVLTLRGHKDFVESVAFSSDGARILSGAVDKTVRVWDAATGAELLRLQGHDDVVQSVAYSRDGSRIVSGSRDRTVRVWDAAVGTELLTLRGHESWVTSVAISPDGARIASGGSSLDHTVRVWDAVTGRELFVLRGHKDWVTSVAFSPSGERISSGSWDGTIRIWNAVTGNKLRILRGNEVDITSVVYSPDGLRIASGSNDQAVRVWDASTGAELLELCGHGNTISAVAFSPDGARIISGSWDDTVRVWDTVMEDEPLKLRGHENSVRSLAFSPDGMRIVSGSRDQTVRLWDATTATELLTLSGHNNSVASVAFSPDNRRIVSGSWDDTVRVWDAATGAKLNTLRGHRMRVESVAVSSDGARIVSGAWDNIRVWELVTGNQLLVLGRDKENKFTSVAFSPNGGRIISGSWNKTVQVWDVATGDELLTLRGHDHRITRLAYSADEFRIVSGSADKTVRVWDAATGTLLETLIGESDVTAVSTKTNTSFLAVARSQGTVIVKGDGVGVALFPTPFSEIVADPRGEAMWIGAEGDHIQIIRLEQPTAAAANQKSTIPRDKK